MVNIELNNKERDFVVSLLQEKLDSTQELSAMQTSQNILRKFDSNFSHYTYLSDRPITKGYDT